MKRSDTLRELEEMRRRFDALSRKYDELLSKTEAGEFKKRAVEEYLDALSEPPPVLPSGRAAYLTRRPKTIEEAGEIAKRYLD